MAGVHGRHGVVVKKQSVFGNKGWIGNICSVRQGQVGTAPSSQDGIDSSNGVALMNIQTILIKA